MEVSDPLPGQDRPAILVVDDDEDFRELLVRLLREGAPCLVEQASSAGEARTFLAQHRCDVVITDLSMPAESGLSLMRWAQERCPGPAWIVLTGYGTFDAAVQALQLGAFDFLEKPLRGVEAVQNAVRNALAQQRLLAERDRLHAELEQRNASLRHHVYDLEQAQRLLREQADQVRADLHRAGIIQQALLPQVAPQLPGFRLHALYRPSHSIGGDLYDVVRLDDRHAVLLIADAAGHGLSAAMLAVLFRSQLPFLEPDRGVPRRPCDVLRAANRSLCDGFPAPGLFLTAAYCLLDLEGRTATIASAGHPPLLLLRRGGEVERIFHTGPALGLYPEADYAQQDIALEPDDRMVLYSDGLYDALPANGRAPAERIAEALSGDRERGLADWAKRAGALAPASDAGGSPEDDLTLVLLDVTPGRSALDNGALQQMPASAPPASDFEVLVGKDERRQTFSIQGRASWTRSAAFHAACLDALESGRRVMLDLTLCENLDSTFLGTIHELAERAERADVELRLQGVAPPVEALFAELGMKRVLERVVPCMLPLPTKMEPLGGEPDEQYRARLTLRAHESLAGLSERNRREFDPLLALLRREVAATSR